MNAAVTIGAVPPATGPSQSWGSGGHRHWRVWVVGRQEFLPETGAERAVVEGAADLEQQIGPAPGPAPLLRLGHAAVHQEVGRALGQRRADPLPGPVPFDVIDQMGALGAQVAVHRVPLRWLTAGEPWPTSLRSGRKAEDLLYKGSLRRHVTPGHGTHLSLGQYRHRLHPGQRPLRRPEALKAEPGPGQALDPAVIPESRRRHPCRSAPRRRSGRYRRPL